MAAPVGEDSGERFPELVAIWAGGSEPASSHLYRLRDAVFIVERRIGGSSSGVGGDNGFGGDENFGGGAGFGGRSLRGEASG